MWYRGGDDTFPRGKESGRGAVLASVPNVAHWTVRLRLLQGRFEYAESGIMDATHLRWFTADTVRRLFASAGYRVQTMVGSAGLWLPEYRRGLWRCVPQRIRRPAIRRAVQLLPGLFACQHVVKAIPRFGFEGAEGFCQ